MANKNLQLNWLRTFEAVGRLLSFSRAAVELNMTQSAVSQQIKLLEHRLGKLLLTRKGRTAELTTAGRAFYGVVREGLSQVEQGIESIFGAPTTEVVDLSVNNSFLQLCLAPRLPRFCASYPNIRTNIYGVNWEETGLPGTADIEIRYGYGNWTRFEDSRLLSSELRPFCSHTVAAQLKDGALLSDYPLIDVLGTPVGWTEWLEKYKVGRERLPRLYVDSYAVAASIAVTGYGICLLHDEFLVDSYLKTLFVSPRDGDTIEANANYYLLKPLDRTLSRAALVLYLWLQTEFANAISSS
jgi:LysR family glycine cleavage system transcriptional activator